MWAVMPRTFALYLQLFQIRYDFYTIFNIKSFDSYTSPGYHMSRGFSILQDPSSPDETTPVTPHHNITKSNAFYDNYTYLQDPFSPDETTPVTPHHNITKSNAFHDNYTYLQAPFSLDETTPVTPHHNICLLYTSPSPRDS